jgi:hypothetical protein
MKKAWNLPTVWVALGAVVLAVISIYLPWLTYRKETASLIEVIESDPDFFTGFLPLIFIGLAWNVAFFLLNHPKLTLLGNLPVFFCGLIMIIAIGETPADLGFGAILFMIASVTMIVMAFATKKIRKAKPVTPVAEQL